MAAVVSSWESLSALATAMQNAVPNTFSKVEIAESGDYAGHLVAYDDENNVFLSIARQNSITVHLRSGQTIVLSDSYWSISKIAVCTNGLILSASSGNLLALAKDHRGKLVMCTPDNNGNSNNQNAFACDTDAVTTFTYGTAQVTEQTNLCHMMMPKAGTEANYVEHGYMAIQCNANTGTPAVCMIAGKTFISCWRWYIMDA